MKKQEIDVLYVGEHYLVTRITSCGFDSITHTNDLADLSHDLMKALSSDPAVRPHHMPCHVAFRAFPSIVEELNKYDVLILSDIGATSLLFQAPAAYSRGAAPNRLEVIREFVRAGNGLLMNGGWFTFSGYNGMGRWHNTPVEDVLPVDFQNCDDRVEGGGNTFRLKTVRTHHPVMSGIPWEEMPGVLGYNKAATLKSDALMLAKFGNDPAIAVREYGKGRTMIYASDPAPDWAGPSDAAKGYFRNWKYYSKFWVQAVKWLARRS